MDDMTLVRVIAGALAMGVFLFIVWRRRRQTSD